MDESTDNLITLETLLEGFHSDGNYIHGYVTDETRVHKAVEVYRRITATAFSVRTSTPLNFEPSKAMKGKFSTRSIKFTKSSCPNLNEDGVPFMHGGRKILECQFGPKREHEKKSERDDSAAMPVLQTLEEMEHDYTPACGPAVKRKRINIRGTRKKGCQARISIVQVCRFPEYAVFSKKCISIQQIQLKERLLQDLNDGKEVKIENRFYIDLPLDKAHSKHPAGSLSGMAQTVHPQIIQWIDELVGEGVTNPTEMQGKLRQLVNTRMSDTAAPNLQDRGYYPKLRDIKNHIYRAKVRRRMPNLGREDIAELGQDDIGEPKCEPGDCDDIYAEVLVLRQQSTDGEDDLVGRQREELLLELEVLRDLVHQCSSLAALQRLTADTRAMQERAQNFLEESPEALMPPPSD
ncbi:calcium-responsive transcription factor-like [Conger conger]|uniref:calcium-responsive transcription factor-like n=1 Tax=Conger conger TaxID=82655 RepID=UPI002A5A7432|nr:calcium-responsive transcription factor-like [Conger conger]XP_061111639.1 calcium-responsive transcription factor-like [Conger conger]XP_061111640.1 calcium-responsive transcription factor-like [Conger conger]